MSIDRIFFLALFLKNLSALRVVKGGRKILSFHRAIGQDRASKSRKRHPAELRR